MDVVVIGAGVIGCSVAAHVLRRAARTRVHVLEAGAAAGMQSTARGAGGVRAQFGSELNARFSVAGIEEFERLGAAVEFRQRGYLMLASDERYLDEVVPRQQAWGVAVERWSMTQLRSRAPWLDLDGLVGAAFGARDGYLDPYSVCRAFEREARDAGATFRFGAAVAELGDDRVVLGDGSSIAFDRVVLAAGHRSAELAALPVVPGRHQLAVTEGRGGVPEGAPMVVDLATGFHFRPEGRGLLLGYNDPPTVDCAAPAEDAPPFDEAFLPRLAEAGVPRFPALADLGISPRHCWAGWYAETPDHHAILDRVGSRIYATGFSGHGIMHAPAAGIAAAELVLDGACRSFDLGALRVDRFADGGAASEALIL